MSPADDIPPGTNCNWCPEPATLKLTIHKKVKGGWVGSNSYMFACYGHQNIARETTHDFANDHSAS